MLAKYPEVERQHYKLWLAGTNVLQSILSNDVLGRSSFELEEIQEFLPKYVRTENHKIAFEKLEELGSIIINGEPGIGKTTLAEQMCFEYASQDYQLVVVHESIVEAEKLYSLELKQIFYFDDFLGSNFLSAIDAKQDSHIVSFMKRVSKDSLKRFILTTRSNILNQGKRLSEKFEQGNLDRNEYEIKIQSLTEFDRAQILYNHIYFSDLSEDFVQQIYVDKRYRSIISHQNFNPRLIEFITDVIKVEKEASPENYWDYIQKSLDNPKDIWRGMVQTQISDLDRHIVIAIVLNGSPVSEEQIVALLTNLKESGLDLTSEYPTVSSIMRGLVGSVLNRNINKGGQVTYSLFNPSIADFVISEYFDRADYVTKLVSCLRTKNALSNIERLTKSTDTHLEFNTLLVRLFQSELDSELTPDLYSIRLIELTEKLEYDFPRMVKKLIDSYSSTLFECLGKPSVKILSIAVEQGFFSFNDPYIKQVVNEALKLATFDDFKDISRLIRISDFRDELVPEYKEYAVEYICTVINEWAKSDNIFDEVYHIEELDIDDIHLYIENILNDLEDDFEYEEVNFETIIEYLDIDDIIYSNIEKKVNDERGAESYRETRGLNSIFNSTVDPIDDLFEK